MRRFIASAALVLLLVLGAVPAATAAPSDDNPCQIPISNPIALVFIAQGLIFVPVIPDSGSLGAYISWATHGHSGPGQRDLAAICD